MGVPRDDTRSAPRSGFVQLCRCTGRQPLHHFPESYTLARAVVAGERQTVGRTEFGLLELKFGFLPEALKFDAGSLAIHPLGTDFRSLLSSPRVHDDWFYPPLTPEWMSANDIGNKHINFAPWFALPSTHRLRLTSDESEELAHFLVATLGVLKGLQLVPEGWGHFYRTPVKAGRLVDFLVRAPACERILSVAREHWLRLPTVRTWMFGAMHWHMFGPTYEHPFEQFGVAYSVLDTCWRIHSEIAGIQTPTSHAARIVQLCEAYDLSLPVWGELNGKSSPLSKLRNEYLHESLWGGQPIGFGHPTDIAEIHLELFWFNTRLLLAMLGERSDYTRSAISYQNQMLT